MEKDPIVSGVPQESVLGPVLFLIFINDQPEDINSRKRLFADDCILYRQISSENDQQLLQEDLDRRDGRRPGEWSFIHRSVASLRISRARTPRTFQYYLKGVPLSEEQSSKYLGVDLQVHSDLSWTNHISWINKSPTICSRFPEMQSTTSKRRFTLPWYDPTWTTVLQSSPYQRNQKHQVEMVPRRSARFVTSRYRKTSSVTDMLDYLGWESHETRRSKLQLIILYKIVHGLIDTPLTDYLTQTNSRTTVIQINLFPPGESWAPKTK